LLRDAGRAMPDLTIASELVDDGQSLAEIRQKLEALNAKPTDKVTLRIGNTTLVESSIWHDWWREFRKGLSSTPATKKSEKPQRESTRLMRCFASGDLVAPVATNPKIEGLADVGGQSMGTALVSFDKDSFSSYGLSQSE